jgi:hypothetical protein
LLDSQRLVLCQECQRAPELFYNYDPDRERCDPPCDSWPLQEHLFGMTRIVYWYNKLRRGEKTREEYHRLVLDFAARLEAEYSSLSRGSGAMRSYLRVDGFLRLSLAVAACDRRFRSSC